MGVFKISGAFVRAGTRCYGPFATAELAAVWMNEHGNNFASPQSIELLFDGMVFACEARFPANMEAA